VQATEIRVNQPRNINSFQQACILASRKVFISTIRIINMKGPYEFLQPLKKLKQAQRRYERTLWALNLAVLSIAVYCLTEVIGLPAFMSFYYQDEPVLANSPVIFSFAVGLAVSVLIKRRRKPDIFPLLGTDLSEKTRTAYDNREVESLPMKSLATDLKAGLSSIKPSMVLDSRQINVRALVILLLFGAAFILAQSEIVNPSDFQSLADIRDRARSVFEEERSDQSSDYKINLTGNIFGKPSLAVLNENKMDIMLYPGLGAGSLARNAEPVERVFKKSQAGEAAAVPSELYIESLPPENKEIIKRYFTILSETER